MTFLQAQKMLRRNWKKNKHYKKRVTWNNPKDRKQNVYPLITKTLAQIPKMSIYRYIVLVFYIFTGFNT
jgi:LPS O-antigen subunit length determinant protein (WzzB/FepE family)